MCLQDAPLQFDCALVGSHSGRKLQLGIAQQLSVLHLRGVHLLHQLRKEDEGLFLNLFVRLR